ncbi:MFS transporter [Peribacillus deserti]|uniref:MFS transporter n=1 Tax=Peribacillus deserti TaxID=673318 RepID=A0A2N5M8D4_9BACI|nr:MFS transporter [Peribacillus deserti]PLT30641.1 MFS transporter [Peribacillus deserti]
METWKKNLWVLWFGVFITSASFSMVIPFLPLFLLQIGVHEHTEIWSGVTFSAAFLAGAVSAPFWGSLADRFGRKPMIIRAGFFLFVIYTLMAFVSNPYEMLGLRIAQGLLTGFIPGAIALIGTNTPEKKVGYALATISTGTASGGIIGPMLGGGIADLVGYRWSFASGGTLVLISTLLVLLMVKEEKFVPSKERKSFRKDIREAVTNQPFMLVLLITMMAACSVMILEPVLPLYITGLSGSSGSSSFVTGMIFSIPGIASILVGPFWGKLSDKVGFRSVLLIGLLGGGLGSIAQLLLHDIWGFSIMRFLFGLCFCAVFPALNGLIVKLTSPETRGRAFGLSQTSNQLGGMLGPILGGLIGGFFSLHTVFLFTGLILLIATGMAFRFTKKQRDSRTYKKAEGM